MPHDPEWAKMSKKARQKYVELLRNIPIGRRFEITAQLCDLVRETMAAGIRAANPGISDEEIRKEIIRRTIPEELRKKAYGW